MLPCAQCVNLLCCGACMLLWLVGRWKWVGRLQCVVLLFREGPGGDASPTGCRGVV